MNIFSTPCPIVSLTSLKIVKHRTDFFTQTHGKVKKVRVAAYNGWQWKQRSYTLYDYECFHTRSLPGVLIHIWSSAQDQVPSMKTLALRIWPEVLIPFLGRSGRDNKWESWWDQGYPRSQWHDVMSCFLTCSTCIWYEGACNYYVWKQTLLDVFFVTSCLLITCSRSDCRQRIQCEC